MLSAYGDTENALWNFLMGTAKYYNGQVSESLVYFKKAKRLDPYNAEYRAVADRMEQSRKGNIHGTSWNGKGNRTTDANCDGIGPLIRCGILSRCL